MRSTEAVSIPLAGLVLADARTGERLNLGTLSGVSVLTAIRHRY